MATYALMLRSQHTDLEIMTSALSRAQFLVENGHQIKQVFFFGASTMLANRWVEAGNNCPNFQSQWINFSATHNVPLVACASVGKTYGLVADQGEDNNIVPGFSAGGLTEFVALLTEVDHVEQF